MRRPWLLPLLAAVVLGVPLDGCSLRDVKHDNCTGDDQCANAFGAGSTCSGGFCTEPAGCTTGHDCRKSAGGGACVNGACVGTFPTDPACNGQYNEPPDLLTQRADGSNAPVVIGAIFSLEGKHEQALANPNRLAVPEINKIG